MPWETSHRKSELPGNWAELRKQAKARAEGVCEWRDSRGVRCTRQGRELHHAGDKFDHDLVSLMWICTEHHKLETDAQGKAAQHAKYIAAKKRPGEAHPGILGRSAREGTVLWPKTPAQRRATARRPRA